MFRLHGGFHVVASRLLRPAFGRRPSYSASGPMGRMDLTLSGCSDRRILNQEANVLLPEET